MINIIVDAENKRVEIEGETPILIPALVHPATVINLISAILNKAYYSGETLCLELKDELGKFHEVGRWK